MRAILHASLLAVLLPAAAPDARERPTQQPQAVPVPVPKTAKERLGGKGTDEQRVDDCKVPPERRTRPRPAACPWEFGS